MSLLPATTKTHAQRLYELHLTKGGVSVWQRGYGLMVYDRRALETVLSGTLQDEHGDKPPERPSRREVLSKALNMLK